ncbi:MAG: LmeA family phospholipid-binding protein [Anaerolineae bacterium]|nr:LmeA family phospholipid-binding protein [Anaerolineae bacterium]
MKKQPHYKLLFVFFALLLITMACRLNIGNPPTPTVPPQNPQELIEQIGTQLAPGAGSYSVTLTEAQVNALVASQFKSQQDYPISDPKVDLRPGTIAITGKLQGGILSSDFEIAVQPFVDESGTPQFKMVSANFGVIPVPDNLSDIISSMFNQMLADSIAASGEAVQIQKIEVTEDTITISGQKAY